MSSLNYHPAGVATYMTLLSAGVATYMTLLSAGEAPLGATTLAGFVSTFSITPRKTI